MDGTLIPSLGYCCTLPDRLLDPVIRDHVLDFVDMLCVCLFWYSTGDIQHTQSMPLPILRPISRDTIK